MQDRGASAGTGEAGRGGVAGEVRDDDRSTGTTPFPCASVTAGIETIALFTKPVASVTVTVNSYVSCESC